MGERERKQFAFYAVTNAYTRYGGWGMEPPEYGCDVVAVAGDTVRECRSAAVRAFRKMRSDGIDWALSPFGQFKLEPATGCRHGLMEVVPSEDATEFHIVRDCPICDWEWAYESNVERQMEGWEAR